MLGPSRLLTLTRKSKFSKRTCPTQFFEHIPILGPVSSFEVQKLCKRQYFQKVDFCANIDQKIKIFKTDLSHSIFRAHSDFGTRFFIRSSEIVQTSNFQKIDFCANVDQMSKFLRWTYLAQFFEYIPILESVPSFET